MKWLKNIQANSITFSLYFILFFIASNGILDYYNRMVFEQSEAAVRDVKAVQLTMGIIIRNLNNCDLGFRGYYIMPNEKLLNPYTEALDSLPQHFKKVRTIMARQGINPDEILPVETAFSNYYKVIDQMIEWRKQDNLDAIRETIEKDPGYDVWIVYKTFNEALDKKEQAILDASHASTERLMFISTIVKALLFLLGIPTVFIVLIRLKRERESRKRLFRELYENNNKYLFKSGEEAAELDEKKIIALLITNLQKATSFISGIAKGNFDIKWEGLNEENLAANKENLAGELLLMKEQMVKVKQEDQMRMWATEGISKFAELVRQHQDDVQQLSDKITSTVVKYLGANQASLFFVEDKGNKEVVLQLYGCYAYDRKKYLHKTLEPGEGLVGQTYLEKELTYLTHIPQNYVTITSGLGEANPSSIVIVPLKFNDQVEGILEIASFRTFAPHELDFLQKIGEIIASAIITLRSSTEMKGLMENLQYQSEEMKAQEEEMRQNMEELQATQEEMGRKAREYQQLIEQREAELAQMQQENQVLKNQLAR
ncbi:GAF domain-containing protein [Cesiribacter sp. SM1]|uniref:GAF domain-containing protein n=1 Tax=Cesiribacter sp. SM1 TaxID=2861196 RepID=UPI001CD4A3A7|nr:GAF domain-containing protein [Cesiribacter sp. SM1]